MIYIEGLLYVMRQIVIYSEDRGEIELSRGEASLIREVEYLARDNDIVERPRFVEVKQNFRLTLRLFPRVFGSKFEVDYSAKGWAKFRRLVELRNELTHPKAAVDSLLKVELPNTIMDAALWFFDVIPKIVAGSDRVMMEESALRTAEMPEARALRQLLADPPQTG